MKAEPVLCDVENALEQNVADVRAVIGCSNIHTTNTLTKNNHNKQPYICLLYTSDAADE